MLLVPEHLVDISPCTKGFIKLNLMGFCDSKLTAPRDSTRLEIFPSLNEFPEIVISLGIRNETTANVSDDVSQQ